MEPAATPTSSPTPEQSTSAAKSAADVSINASLAAVADVLLSPDLGKVPPPKVPAATEQAVIEETAKASEQAEEELDEFHESRVRQIIKAGASRVEHLAEEILRDAISDTRPLPKLLAVMARLRAPGGCPWDREQTRETLKQQIVEEVYELVEAIEDRSESAIREELGDILLHVVFHSHIGREEKKFTFADVVKTLVDKLIRRHPHVFGDVQAEDSATVLTNWNAIKASEKPERTSALDGVPRSLPALMRAFAVQKKAAAVGFDWPDATGPKAKLHEELEEFEQELPALKASPKGSPEAQSARDRAEDELGDVLFAVVNWSRHLKLDPEEALNRATKKFATRFREVEAELTQQNRTAAECSLDELEELWTSVKARHRSASASESGN
ncbi:MAG: nucleoside triphosphate pyrophosphohydrolase [Candidatus Methylacidiphilales bacterium]